MYTCRILSFGRGGHTEHYCSRKEGTLSYGASTLSGYDRPETWKPRAETDYTGAIVVDKRDAVETPEGYAWVFRGPLVSPDLQLGEVDRLPKVSPIMAGAMALTQFGTLLAIAEAQRGLQAPGSLDHVCPEVYAAGWREHGARVGQVVDGAIVWADELQTA